MKIIEVTPRGYCLGVVNAINLVSTLKKKYPNKKIHVLGMLVHNSHITEKLLSQGISVVDEAGKSRLELLDQIDNGVVVITAHGASDEIKLKAHNRGLIVEDATCVYVRETHKLIKAALKNNKKVLYLGKKGHPECEGALGIDPSITLVESYNDVTKYSGSNYFITNQTTLSHELVNQIFDYCKKKGMEVADEICNATKERQLAITNLPNDVDLLVVVGDRRSNNSNKLVDLGQQRFPSVLVETIHDVDDSWFSTVECVAITSGASTPTEITNQVINYVKKLVKV